MYQTTIYKYPEARLMLQSLSSLDFFGLRARQGGVSIQTYHTTNMICTMQESNLFTSILRLDWDRKAGPLGFVGPWTYARRDIRTNISYYKYNMYHARIKRIYKYSEARLMMQSLSPLGLLSLGGMQGASSIQIYHTTHIICTMQESNYFTSILRLDLWCKAWPPRIWLALYVCKEGHPYIHITLQM